MLSPGPLYLPARLLKQTILSHLGLEGQKCPQEEFGDCCWLGAHHGSCLPTGLQWEQSTSLLGAVITAMKQNNRYLLST